MIERAKPIDAFLGKGAKLSLEDIAGLDEEHRLALDKPRYEIVAKGQSELFPQVVRMITLARTPELHEALLAKYGLNSGVYSENDNPQGVFSQKKIKHTANDTVVTAALLRLANVRVLDAKSFFNDASGAPTVKPFLSVAFDNAVAQTDRKRENFAFDHPERFLKIRSLTESIHGLTGLAPTELFKEGRTPPIFDWRKTKNAKESPILLEDFLRVIEIALKGEMNMAQIGRHVRRSPSGLRDFLLGNKERESALTSPLEELVKAKIKIDPRGRKPHSATKE